ncbi:MAG: DUF4177 domain-containing protein [Candidatus Hydrogenedentes bacterium]|nr:DUF4177 domain-containing protein [Candidatus Hydrogenedentota bacterium]
MYEYEFVRIKARFWSSEPREDYRDIVREYAAQKWRLVQVFAPPVGVYGTASWYELIFERER